MPTGFSSLNGVALSNIAAGIDGSQSLHIFIRGNDRRVYRRWQNPDGSWNGGNDPWGAGAMGDHDRDGEIGVGRNSDGRLEVFVRDTSNAVGHRWQGGNDNGWNDGGVWDALGGVKTSNVGVNVAGSGCLEIFARGTDNAVWHRWQKTPGGFFNDEGWQSMGGNIVGDITVARNADGRLELFVRDRANVVHNRWQGGPGGWNSEWSALGGLVGSNVTVGLNTSGRLEIFARGTDNQVYHRWRDGGTWLDRWLPLTGILSAGDIAVARNGNDCLEIFTRGTDNQVYTSRQSSPGNSAHYLGWEPLQSGFLTTGDVTAISKNGRVQVFVRGLDQAVWHCET